MVYNWSFCFVLILKYQILIWNKVRFSWNIWKPFKPTDPTAFPSVELGTYLLRYLLLTTFRQFIASDQCSRHYKHWCNGVFYRLYLREVSIKHFLVIIMTMLLKCRSRKYSLGFLEHLVNCCGFLFLLPKENCFSTNSCLSSILNMTIFINVWFGGIV